MMYVRVLSSSLRCCSDIFQVKVFLLDDVFAELSVRDEVEKKVRNGLGGEVGCKS